MLILELDGYKTHEMLVKIEEGVKENLREANVLTEVKNIVLTRTNLMDKDDFKISRTKIAKNELFIDSRQFHPLELTINICLWDSRG